MRFLRTRRRFPALIAVGALALAGSAIASSATPMRLTDMNDDAAVGKVMLDELELQRGDGHPQGYWDAEAWYGNDYDKLWLKSEGYWPSGQSASGRYEALWDRSVLRWWDAQAGVRVDLGRGVAREWAAVGVQGLAPYEVDVETTLYVSDDGRAAARLQAQRDLLLTQRLILQPQVQSDLYTRSDPARQIGAGLSDLQLALRLRYEFHRQLAPYLGVVWQRQFGRTAQLFSDAGGQANVTQWVAGVHLWF